MPHLAAVLPEIVILSAACVILIVDLFVPQRRRAVSFWLTQAALALAIVVVVSTAQIAPSHAFGGMVVADMLGDVLKLFALVAPGNVLVALARQSLDAFDRRSGFDAGQRFTVYWSQRLPDDAVDR